MHHFNHYFIYLRPADRQADPDITLCEADKPTKTNKKESKQKWPPSTDEYE